MNVERLHTLKFLYEGMSHVRDFCLLTFAHKKLTCLSDIFIAVYFTIYGKRIYFMITIYRDVGGSCDDW